MIGGDDGNIYVGSLVGQCKGCRFNKFGGNKNNYNKRSSSREKSKLLRGEN